MNLIDLYDKLLTYFGEQGWWPAESEFEVIVGAILTQASSWYNVERVIKVLKAENLLTPQALLKVDEGRLKEFIRPVGYYNAKSRKLKTFVGFLYENYDGNLETFLSQDLESLRSELLSIWGVGEETADSIILYAAGKPSFVVDAYTKRILGRSGLVDGDVSYSDLKSFFELQLPVDVSLYREFHALLVELGKNYCKTKPVCGSCPLTDFCVEWKNSSGRR